MILKNTVTKAAEKNQQFLTFGETNLAQSCDKKHHTIFENTEMNAAEKNHVMFLSHDLSHDFETL